MNIPCAKLESTCSRCGRTKPITEFYVRRSGKPHPFCKLCFRRYNRERRAKWTDEEWAAHYASSERWRKENRERVNAQAKLRNRRRRLPRKPGGCVHVIPSGRMKGRLQLDYRDSRGKRRRTLCPKGTTHEQAKQMLHKLQDRTEYKLKVVLRTCKRGDA